VGYTVCHILYGAQSGHIPMDSERIDNLRLELRRGCLALAVLAQLRGEHYGYTLRKALDGHGLAIDEGTLYPLLRRLESHGLLESEWREEEKRNKRFYRLTRDGEAILEQLMTEWRGINGALERILAQRKRKRSERHASG
jgi:PadR family transcriptional regulator PadR